MEYVMRNRHFAKIESENQTICLRVSEIESIGYDADYISVGMSSGHKFLISLKEDQNEMKTIDEILSGYDIVVSAIYRK